MTNWNDLPLEMKKLVVEEKKNEKNWNDLPFEMKEMVVKEMDLETRTRLKMCSKSDKYLVESIRMLYDKLDVKVWERDEKMIVDVLLYRDKTENPDLHLHLIEDKKIVFISKPPKDAKKIQCSSAEDAKNMITQLFFNIFFNGNLRFKEFKADIEHPDFIDNSEFTIHANEVDIYASLSQIIQWLNNIAPGVKTILAVNSEDVVRGIGSIPAVINADVLRIYCASDINNDQLATFKCTSLYIQYTRLYNEYYITGKGMNQFIKKAITNDYPKGASFRIMVDPEKMIQFWNVLIEGLDVEVTESSDCTNMLGQLLINERKGRIQMSHSKYMTLSYETGSPNPYQLYVDIC